ncbi:hypothetical protein TrST_g441 [Triparma strigata]|uniref:t-SNARE coiled-coil homology domain-containing protein n=1 Tax=Triparma strigata TaxID=1606541 RepID=A0A9W7B361_9STRA|nr:hypothetical protein TrST_g441 [Triparma strigata]
MSFATLSSSDAHSTHSSNPNLPPPVPSQSSSSSSSLHISNSTLSNLSDSITTYQRNVSLLHPLITSPTPDTPSQFPILLSICSQLRQKTSASLASARSQVTKMERTDASKFRGILVKLGRDFERVEREQDKLKTEYERTQKLKSYSDQQAQINQNRRPDSDADLDIKPSSFILKQEDTIQNDLITDRNREILQINSEMSKVNEIFKDLAGIVDGQQSEIDNIETLMEQSNMHAKKGLEQVREANEYQKGCILS